MVIRINLSYLGDLLQELRAPGDDGEALVAPAGQVPGDLGADAGAGAGDEHHLLGQVGGHAGAGKRGRQEDGRDGRDLGVAVSAEATVKHSLVECATNLACDVVL